MIMRRDTAPNSKSRNLLRRVFAHGWLLVLLIGCTHAVEEVRLRESTTDTTDEQLKSECVKNTDDTLLPTADDWPWWRGTNRTNHALGVTPPTQWDQSHNVFWRADVPGRGHASPILWGERIFVATADEQSQQQSLVCYDRATGTQQWQKSLHKGPWPAIHAKNSHASPTPATDGHAVYTAFALTDAIWVTAVDLSGEILWQQEAGPFLAPHGYGSSPVIYKSFVIVQSDNKNGGFLAALDRKTGAIMWRVRRARNDSYGTPIIGHVAGKDQLLTSGQDLTISYDPNTGEELWRCNGPSEATANTIAFQDNLVISSGGYPEQNVMAIRANGSGDVTETHIAWQANFKMYVPSALIIKDRVLATGDAGVCVLYNLADGDELWKQRIASGGGFSASPVLVEDLIYVPDEKGVVHVLRVGEEKLEKVATNDLDDGGMASPVIAGGRLYLRTAHSLFCIGTIDTPAETKQP